MYGTVLSTTCTAVCEFPSPSLHPLTCFIQCMVLCCLLPALQFVSFLLLLCGPNLFYTMYGTVLSTTCTAVCEFPSPSLHPLTCFIQCMVLCCLLPALQFVSFLLLLCGPNLLYTMYGTVLSTTCTAVCEFPSPSLHPLTCFIQCMVLCCLLPALQFVSFLLLLCGPNLLYTMYGTVLSTTCTAVCEFPSPSLHPLTCFIQCMVLCCLLPALQFVSFLLLLCGPNLLYTMYGTVLSTTCTAVCEFPSPSLHPPNLLYTMYGTVLSTTCTAVCEFPSPSLHPPNLLYTMYGTVLSTTCTAVCEFPSPSLHPPNLLYTMYGTVLSTTCTAVCVFPSPSLHPPNLLYTMYGTVLSTTCTAVCEFPSPSLHPPNLLYTVYGIVLSTTCTAVCEFPSPSLHPPTCFIQCMVLCCLLPALQSVSFLLLLCGSLTRVLLLTDLVVVVVTLRPAVGPLVLHH